MLGTLNTRLAGGIAWRVDSRKALEMNDTVTGLEILRPIGFVLALVGPGLVAILIAYFWFGPRAARMPAPVAGIPLALASIPLLVLIGTGGVLMGFQEIAVGKLRGIRNVAEIVAQAAGSLPLAIALSIGCVAALLVFQGMCDRREGETESSGTPRETVPRILFSLSVLSAFATIAAMWYFYQTLDLILAIVDKARNAEAQFRLEQMGVKGIGEAARIISSRLLWGGGLSFVVAGFCLVAAILLCRVGEVPDWIRTHSWTFAIVLMACLAGFGVAYHQELQYVLSLAQLK
jgi:hypothetical protein